MLCLCMASAALYRLRIILRVDTGGGSAQVMREDMRNDGVSGGLASCADRGMYGLHVGTTCQSFTKIPLDGHM